jgi:hypothetical protein
MAFGDYKSDANRSTKRTVHSAFWKFIAIFLYNRKEVLPKHHVAYWRDPRFAVSFAHHWFDCYGR